MHIVHVRQSRRELAHRSGNGIHVSLLWSPADDAVVVVVDDETGESFELAVGPGEALDAFNHPFAYAASRGFLGDAALAA